MTGVMSGGPGFVAIGSAGQAPAASTTSDGKRSQLVSLRISPDTTVAALQKVAAWRNVIVAPGPRLPEQNRTVGGVLHRPRKHLARDAAERTWPTCHRHDADRDRPRFRGGPDRRLPGNRRVVIWSSRTGAAWKAREPVGAALNSPGRQAITALTASQSTLTGVGYLTTPAGEEATPLEGRPRPGLSEELPRRRPAQAADSACDVAPGGTAHRRPRPSGGVPIQ